MIDVNQIAADAAREYPLSLRDDPSAWTPPPASWTEIQDACNATIRDNARSATARAIGKQIETVILPALLVAAHEDGPLADLGAVWREHVTGMDVDCTPVMETEDWDEQLLALRTAVGQTLDARQWPDCGPTLRAYVESEPRLAKVLGGLQATARDYVFPAADAFAVVLVEPLVDKTLAVMLPVIDWDDDAEDADDFVPPAHVAKVWERPLSDGGKLKKRARRTNAQIAADEAANRAANIPPRVLPKLPGLLYAAGMTDEDAGTLFNVSRPYWGMVRRGDRNWNGAKPSEVAALRGELEGRIGALQQALASLDDKANIGPTNLDLLPHA